MRSPSVVHILWGGPLQLPSLLPLPLTGSSAVVS